MNDKEVREILNEAQDRYTQAEEYDREDLDLMQEDFCFAAGEQWPDQIERARTHERRPTLTFNRLPQFIQQVVGDARQNRPSIKVHPVDSGADKDLAEVYEGLIRNVEAQSRATSAYVTAFEHAVTGSRGAWRVHTEYASDDSFEQDIRIKRINNPFAVRFDPAAVEYDKSDAKWCFVSEWMTLETFEARWPDKTPHDWEEEYRDLSCGVYWRNDDRVRVAEYWIKKPVTRKLGLTAEGQTLDITKARPPLVEIVKERTVKSHQVCRYLLTGHDVLEGPQEFPSRYIPIIPVYGPEEWLNDRVRHRSLIRYAKDAMRMYNYWQSTIAEKIALAPKQPWLVTTSMIAGLEEMWNKSNRENRPYLAYNVDEDNPGLIPQRQEPAYVNSAEIQQSAQAVEDIKATMGMYDASLGAQGNETSGRAIIARQREGDAATFAWIDNLARSIQHTGRVLVDMIPRIYDTDRIVRVLGEDDAAELVEINQTDQMGNVFNDLTVGKYDVIISVGPSYATKRMEAADSMMAFVQAVPQAAQVAGDLIAKAMDWPGADEIADRLKALLPPGMVEDDDISPEEQQQRQAQAEEQQQKEGMIFGLEVEEKQANIAKTRADAIKAMTDAQAQDIENDAVESGIAEFLSGQTGGA